MKTCNQPLERRGRRAVLTAGSNVQKAKLKDAHQRHHGLLDGLQSATMAGFIAVKFACYPFPVESSSNLVWIDTDL
jgi:hypothetical protein